MGGAIYKALSSTLPQLTVYVCEPEIEKLDQLGIAKKSQFTDVNALLTDHDCEAFLFCLKPQVMDDFKKDLQVDLSQKLILSIMAGVPISKLQNITGSKKIIRSMPNLAAFVSQSLTGWIATKQVSPAEKIQVQKLFQSFGKEVELESEEQINDITALSGSGPAYFFFLTQLMEEKAMQMGFDTTQARTIAEQTIMGAAEVLKTTIKTAKEWKEAVTSPGGTTEAALKHMDELQFHNIFQNSIQKAKERAEELAK